MKPCQDLSNAGQRKGFNDTSTRSGMLWEVERILTECKELGELPQILLLENVPQLHSIGENMNNFQKWINRLEELGYKSYWQDLIATDYGIPQTRNRCFMVSILGEYSYSFPKPIKLEIKLQDLLEDNVDEKYYLSDKMIDYITSEDSKYKVSINNLKINREIACTKTTREGSTRADASDYICEELPNEFNLKTQCVATLDEYNHKINDNETIGTIQAGYYTPNHGHRLIIKVNDVLCTNFIERRKKENDFVQQNNISCTLLTDCGHTIAIGTYQYAKSDKFMNGKDRLQLGKEVSDTIQTTQKKGIVNSDLRIRRLTCKECFRLMGVRDEDYENCAKNQSNASLYHLAGDSIVTKCLCAIFSQLIDN